MTIHLMVDDNSNTGQVEDAGFLAEWSAGYGLEFPVVTEGSGATRQGMYSSGVYTGGIPFMAIVDRDMTLVAGYTGSTSEESAFAKVDELLAP